MTTPRARRHGSRPLVVTAAVVGVAVGVFLLSPVGHVADAAFLTAAFAAAVGAWIGASRSSAAIRPMPQLVAAGLTASAVGDLTYRIYSWTGSEPNVSLADIPWFSAYLALGAALLLAIGRSRASFRLDVHAVLDILSVCCVSVLLMWGLSVESIMADSSVSPFVRTVWAGYPICDSILLALVVRALVSRRSRRSVGFVFVVGVACWLAADLGYLLLAVSDNYTMWLDVGWMLGALLMADMTFRTSPDDLPDVATEDAPPAGYGNVTFALLPLAVPGSIVLAGHLRGADTNPIPGVVATVVLLGLAFVRTISLLRAEQRARDAAKANRRHYERLAANSSDAVIVLDADGRIVHDSPQLSILMGRGDEATAGADLLALVAPEDVEAMRTALDRARQSPSELVEAELSATDPAGGRITLSARIVNLFDDEDVNGILVNLHDITARKQAEDELAHQAFHDSLTGLANRALFRDRVAHAQHRNTRTGHSLAVIYIDLDGFKTVNDSLGHDAGDDLLREVAARMIGAVRPSDTVARLGGDEFAVLVEGSGVALEEATTIADRVLQALTHPIQVADQRTTVSASIGIATDEDGASPAALLRNADIAMYRAKTSGKAQWVSYEPQMRAAAVERLQLETDLGDALAGAQLRLMYQPVVELESQRIVGFEALLRWDHPTLGLIGPDKFIPIAEESGLIVPIGEWVLDTACQTAARWRADYPELARLTMAVNVSARQLESAQLVSHVGHALEQSGLDAGALVLEMTESALIADPAIAARRLHELRKTGVRLAIDDFGTGYSSLSYLRQFPVDILKIDRSFVSSITDRANIPAIVRGLLDLGHTLELEMVAEGVEDDVQRDSLRGENCEFAQGFLFARPLDTADAELLLVQMASTVHPS